MSEKTFENLSHDEKKLFAWKVMRCIETGVPRKIATISNLCLILQAILDIPSITDECKLPELTKEQATQAVITTLAISSLAKMLYVQDATNNNGKTIIDALVQVFREEGISTKNIPITILHVSEFFCQEFLCNECAAN